MHKSLRWYFVAFFLMAGYAVVADQPAQEDPCQNTGPEIADVCFSGAILRASQIALMRFESDQPSAELENFFILVQESDTDFYIGFHVNRDRMEAGANGDKAYIMMRNPHGNRYGRNVTYQVSKESGEILKTTYSK